jgi:hypothetical protein
MNIYQFIEKNQGGSIWFDLPRIGDLGSVTASVYSNTGNDLGSSTVVEYFTSSSLSTAAAAGTNTLTLVSSTGFKVGDMIYVTNTDRTIEASEAVSIKSISGNILTLQRPLTTPQASGNIVAKSRIKITITAAQAANIGKNYVIKINYKTLTEDQPTLFQSFTVSKYLPISNLTMNDLSSIDSTVYKKFPSTFDFQKTKEITWGMLLQRLAANYDPGGLVGTINFTVAHAYLILMVIYETAGPDYDQQRLVMAERFEKEFISACASAAYDEKQTGSTNNILLQKIVLRRV